MPPDEFVDRFAELFAVAYRAAFAVLGDRAEAEDCAQDALARLLDRWDRLDPAATAPWVARVATNRAIDRWRRRERRTAVGNARVVEKGPGDHVVVPVTVDVTCTRDAAPQACIRLIGLDAGVGRSRVAIRYSGSTTQEDECRPFPNLAILV